MHGFGPRIYHTLPLKSHATAGLTVRDVATLSGCAPDTARHHLNNLVKLGLAECAGSPMRFVRLTDTVADPQANAPQVGA